MKQESSQVAQTKERLRNAFFELYATKKIEHISIKEIADLAQLNRGTFYVYYRDIYDLLEKTEDELILELVSMIKDVIPPLLRDDNLGPFLPPVAFYNRNKKILQVLLGPTGDPHFVHKIKGIVKNTVQEIFRRENVPPVKNMEYVVEYIASAQIGIISYWMVEKDMALPVEELGEMIKHIILHGPINYLINTNG